MSAANAFLRDYARDAGGAVDDVTFPDAGAFLAARLPVMELAMGAVAAFASSANSYRAALGLPERTVRVDAERVAASFASDRLFRRDGQPIQGFAPMSGFFQTSDGFVRTHANYTHHRKRLLGMLGLSDESSTDDLTSALRASRAQDIEDRAASVGAIAVRVRTEAEWRASEQGRAALASPLIALHTREDLRAEGVRGARAGLTPTEAAPLRGLRVLDLTRVIAGPVATRCLALLGAEVLRVDPPQLPEPEVQYLDVGQGKRSTLLDLRRPSDLATFTGLLEEADVLVTGYRPGALDTFGLAAHVRTRGRIVATLDAWGFVGPWRARRGFDSIVQAASGIALIEGGERPGALPAQALDHATGYVLAAGVLEALARQAKDGRGREVQAALATTGAWLLDAQGRTAHAPRPAACGASVMVAHGPLETTRPALGDHDDYPWPSHAWGSDAPRWDSPDASPAP